MKKAIIISAIGLLVLLAGSFTYLKLNPPLVIGTLASGNEKTIALVGVGNKGFKGIKISEVLVNNHEQPQNVMVQVSNSLKGFTIADLSDEAAKEYGVQSLASVTIPPKTLPEVQFAKMDEGTATEKDLIYGITTVQNLPINTVILKYRYLGLSFVETITVH